MAKGKILITGVTGFVGSHMAQRLAKTGYEVYGVTRVSSSRNNAELEPYLGGTKVMTCDVSDYYSTYKAIKEVNPGVVVHLAASSSIRDSFEKPFLDVNTNLVGSMNVAHALLELPDFKEKRLLFASAAAVYGSQKSQPIKDDTPVNPLNPYSIDKSVAENYLKMIGRIYGLGVVAMRPTNTYGRKLDGSFYIEYLATSMLKGNKIYLGQPDTVRDYMHVNDHVDAYVKAIEHPGVRGESFNVGTGIGTSNKEVAFKVADLVGFDRNNIALGKYPPNYPFRPYDGDQPKMVIDSTKIRKMLGWKPAVGLDDGLKMTVDFWREKIGR